MTTKDATPEQPNCQDDTLLRLTWRDMYRFLDAAYALGRMQTARHVTGAGKATAKTTAAAAFRIWFDSDQLPISPWGGGVPDDPKHYFYDPIAGGWRGGEEEK